MTLLATFPSGPWAALAVALTVALAARGPRNQRAQIRGHIDMIFSKVCYHAIFSRELKTMRQDLSRFVQTISTGSDVTALHQVWPMAADADTTGACD